MICDGAGLWLEHHPSGVLSWRLRYTLRGWPGKVNLGRYPSVSLADARRRSAAIMAGIREGRSPAEQQRLAKQAAVHWASFKAFGDGYLRYLELNRIRKDIKPIRRYLERDIYPVIGSKQIEKIEADELREMIFARRDEGKPQAALAIRNLLKRLFDYALVCGVVKSNPLLAIPPKFIAKTSSRNRSLDPVEIRIFLRALDVSTKLKSKYKAALLLILLTLTRKGELLLAQWKHIDFGRGEWQIPQENSKTDASQIVYLSRQAIEILRERWKPYHSRSLGKLPNQYVFHAHKSPTQPMSASALNRALLNLRTELKHFTVHDLRRTAATNLSEQEHAADVIEKALNHKIKGVRGVYNRAQYATQRRAMLQDWADWLDSLRASSGAR